VFLKAGVVCESIVLEGIPEDEIQRLVKSRRVDRVIVSVRKISGVARLIEDAVAEKLVSLLDVPVCFVGQRTHAGPAEGNHISRVLHATSLHSRSSVLADFASAVAEANHAHLTLLHVLNCEGMGEQQRELARLAARRRVTALVPNEARHRHDPLLLIREGDPATIVIEETCSLSPDLVILGAPHTSRTPGFLSNNIVHRVISESRCPVITVNSTVLGLVDENRQLTSVEMTSVSS
jgi:nucleotide-binding universal stress UspA family protein